MKSDRYPRLHREVVDRNRSGSLLDNNNLICVRTLPAVCNRTLSGFLNDISNGLSYLRRQGLLKDACIFLLFQFLLDVLSCELGRLLEFLLGTGMIHEFDVSRDSGLCILLLGAAKRVLRLMIRPLRNLTYRLANSFLMLFVCFHAHEGFGRVGGVAHQNGVGVETRILFGLPRSAFRTNDTIPWSIMLGHGRGR